MEEQRARKKQRKVLDMEVDTAEYDILSNLPEPLIHHVLSLLSLQEIVMASAVCKSWGRICSSFPVLDFGPLDFVGEGTPRPVDMTAAQRMVRFVDATMTRFQEQHLKIDKFRVDYHHYFGELSDDCLSRIQRWISIALDDNVQDISIALTQGSRSSRLIDTVTELPSLDLVPLSGSTNGLKSLRSLTLHGFIGGEFLSWGHLMSACGSLESLSISCCGLKEVRISGLPNLKTVSLAGCTGFFKVRISGLPNLKTVSITRCTSTRLVEIDAPSLECFRLNNGGFFVKRTHPCVVNVNHSPNLKSLTLESVAENDGWFRDFLSRFPQLQDLTISSCDSLTRIRISSPSIEDIKIRFCDNLTNISIEALGLRRLCLECSSLENEFLGERTHPCVVNVNHSPNLKSLTLESVAENDGWFRDFLSRFPQLQDLTISSCDSLTRIRISNPSIESIDIKDCDQLTDISIAAPELRRFRLQQNGLLPSIQMENPPRRNPVAEVFVILPRAPGWSSNLSEFLVGSCKSFSLQSFIGYSSGRVFQLRNDIKYRRLGVIACNNNQCVLAQHHATQEALLREVDGTDVSGLIWTPHPATVTAVACLSEDDFLHLFCDKVSQCDRCLRKPTEPCRSYNDIADIKIVPWSNN